MNEIDEYILFNQFVAACESQWRGGGKRYAYGEGKEWTDVITEIIGNKWIGGQILKYAGEIWNNKRMDGVVPEVCFFKIAVYSFMWWLKEMKVKNTDVPLKEKYWPKFVEEFGNMELIDLPVDKEEFVEMVTAIIRLKSKSLFLFSLMAAKSFLWWLQEQGNFTQRDEGEEFTK